MSIFASKSGSSTQTPAGGARWQCHRSSSIREWSISKPCSSTVCGGQRTRALSRYSGGNRRRRARQLAGRPGTLRRLRAFQSLPHSFFCSRFYRGHAGATVPVSCPPGTNASDTGQPSTGSVPSVDPPAALCVLSSVIILHHLSLRTTFEVAADNSTESAITASISHMPSDFVDHPRIFTASPCAVTNLISSTPTVFRFCAAHARLALWFNEQNDSSFPQPRSMGVFRSHDSE